jgi:hypothetical protein
MANINLGRIGMVLKGEWNSSFTYNRLDVVAYGGGGYVSLVDDNNNKLPTDTAYWLQISEKGETGNIDNLEDWHIVDALGYTPANKAVVDAHLAEIATIQDAFLYESISANVSIANDVLTIVQFDQFSDDSNMNLSGDDGQSIVLTEGTYIISAKATFASNATGYRSLLLGSINDSLSLTWRLAYDIKNAVNGEFTVLEVNRILAITSEMKIGLFVKQNSGGALNIISSNMYTALIVRRIL